MTQPAKLDFYNLVNWIKEAQDVIKLVKIDYKFEIIDAKTFRKINENTV